MKFDFGSPFMSTMGGGSAEAFLFQSQSPQTTTRTRTANDDSNTSLSPRMMKSFKKTMYEKSQETNHRFSSFSSLHSGNSSSCSTSSSSRRSSESSNSINNSRHGNSSFSTLFPPTTKTTTTTDTPTTATATNKATTTTNSTTIVDELISSKLNQISLEDRSDGLHDLHGVADLAVETSDVMQDKLYQMTVILQQRYGQDSSSTTSTFFSGERFDSTSRAYQLAMMMNPQYVEETKLICLRAENYHPAEAAERMIRYFRRKLDLFGMDRLVQDITYKGDLTGLEQEALERGIIQLLPQRDRAGRAVLFIDGRAAVDYSNETVMRAIFYMAMVALQDIETQQRGIVGIYYTVQQQVFIQGRAQELWQSWKALPWRMVAFHMCKDSSLLNLPLHAFCSALENRSVCRLRFHNGSAIECIYNLLTFGIAKEALPLQLDGTIDLAAHHAMLESLICREQDIVSNKGGATLNTSNTTATATPAVDAAGSNVVDDEDDFDHDHIFGTNDSTPPDYISNDVSHLDQSMIQNHQFPQHSRITTPSPIMESMGENTAAITTPSPPSSPLPTSFGSVVTTTPTITKPVVTSTATSTSTTMAPNSSALSPSPSTTTTATSTANTSAPTNTTILVPGPLDVIMGRGRRSKLRPGASRFHHLLIEYRDQYDSASKADKMTVADRVLDAMKASGCRFLKSSPKGFVECTDAAARDKISHGFRNLRLTTASSFGDEGNNNNDTGGGGGSNKSTTTTAAKKKKTKNSSWNAKDNTISTTSVTKKRNLQEIASF